MTLTMVSSVRQNGCLEVATAITTRKKTAVARKATLCTVKHSVPGRLKVQVCCDFMLRVSFFTFFAAELAIDTHDNELHLRLSFIKQSITRCEHDQEPAQNAW